MDIIQIVVLSIIQGITEFLPISSSAHLILVPIFTGWQDQGLAFDVMVHAGTLVAVCYYFKNDLRILLVDGIKSLSGVHSIHSRLAWLIILSTLPAVIVGLLFNDWIEQHLRSSAVIATTTIVFALLLAYADKLRGDQNIQTITWQQALFIGSMQALALVPGTSRSGITLTAALIVGMSRQTAMKYSFLLAVPLILAAVSLKTLELVQAPQTHDWFGLLIGFCLSALTAWFIIHVLLKFIEKIGLMPFIIYRLLLGMILISTL